MDVVESCITAQESWGRGGGPGGGAGGWAAAKKMEQYEQDRVAVTAGENIMESTQWHVGITGG